ncbi:hypothetical protein BDW60DRAFT_207906 [Aspergillus nidulans var. acristatus]
MWLDAISAPFFMLRSTITASQRDQAKDDFKDRVANCNVLVTTYAVAAHGLSLQNAFLQLIIVGDGKVQPQEPATELSQKVAQSLVRKRADDLGFTVAHLA